MHVLLCVISTCASATRPEEIQKVEFHPSVLACRVGDKSNLFLYLPLASLFRILSLRINKSDDNLKFHIVCQIAVRTLSLTPQMQRTHAAKCCQNLTQRDENVRNTATMRQILFF